MPPHDNFEPNEPHGAFCCKDRKQVNCVCCFKQRLIKNSKKWRLIKRVSKTMVYVNGLICPQQADQVWFSLVGFGEVKIQPDVFKMLSCEV